MATDDGFRPEMVLGTTGLKQHSGYIDEEFLRRLRGRNAIKTYREMVKNSPILAAAVGLIKMLIREVDWRVEPADESDEAKVEAEDTENALEDMSHTFEDLLSEILSMLWAGYSVFEIVYKIRRGPDAPDSMTRSKFSDGKWGWRKIEIRAQESIERWVFDEEGGLDGYVQQSLYGTFAGTHGPVFIPIDKSLLFRTEIFKGNPEGESLMRPAVVPYWYIKRIQEFEAIGIERNLAGMPVMEVPAELLLPDAPANLKALRADLERWITQVRADERWGGLIPSSVLADGSPSGYNFKLMQSSGRKLVDTDVIVKRYRAEMLMLFMAQFLVMGTGGEGGTRSLSTDMTELFGIAIGSIMDSIATVMNRFLIPRRQRLNGIAPNLDPTIEHGEVGKQRLAEVGSYIQQLSASGMVGPNPALERRLLEIGKLPQPEEQTEAMPPPLDNNTIDAVGRSAFSSEQVTVILDVNKALKAGQLDRNAAIETLAMALGMELEDAERFIPGDSEDTEPAPIAPLPSTPEPDDGSDEDTDPLEEGEEVEG